jgi:putative transposase
MSCDRLRSSAHAATVWIAWSDVEHASIRPDVLPRNHAIGKLACQTETSDARGRFTEDQIIGVLREHVAGMKTAVLCRKHGISDAAFYNWKAKYGGMTALEAARLRMLEDENRRLNKLLEKN